MTSNIKELLLKSLIKTWKQNQVIVSIIWKSIMDDFLKIKKIDISTFLISIQLKWNLIILKTNKPILNAEIMMIQDVLLQNITQKLQNIGIKIKELQITTK
jgi:hypothetical protein